MLEIKINEELDMLTIEDLRYRDGADRCPTASFDSFGQLCLHRLSAEELRKLAEVCVGAAYEIDRRAALAEAEDIPL